MGCTPGSCFPNRNFTIVQSCLAEMTWSLGACPSPSESIYATTSGGRHPIFTGVHVFTPPSVHPTHQSTAKTPKSHRQPQPSSLPSSFTQSLFPPPPTNPPIAPSTPLAQRANRFKLPGNPSNTQTHPVYNGNCTSPLSPASTTLTTSLANSTASTTGPKNELGVSTPAKRLVPSWPGVTKTVRMFLLPAGIPHPPLASSALSELCIAINPAFAAA